MICRSQIVCRGVSICLGFAVVAAIEVNATVLRHDMKQGFYLFIVYWLWFPMFASDMYLRFQGFDMEVATWSQNID